MKTNRSHHLPMIIAISMALSIIIPLQALAQKKNPPLVFAHEIQHLSLTQKAYHKERTLTAHPLLPNPFLMDNGKKEVKRYGQWAQRRAELLASIQKYEIGMKPAVSMDDIDARMNGDTLIVDVHVDGQTLTLSSVITYPKGGEAPYPLIIGASRNSIPAQLFTARNIALMTFRESQVNNYTQWGKHDSRGLYHFDRLYPSLTANGAYSEWAWGFSRLLDGLQKLGPEQTHIDMKHIGVTGCSYAGKMALFCGAMDERVALIIAQEPGGGGAASWRVSRTIGKVETLDRTDYNWFLESMKTTFAEERVDLLPHDHHELIALCCPRAVLLLGNPDYEWLADPSMYVSAEAAIKVWQRFGIADRIGYSIVPGHDHCQLPESQYPEVVAFIERFLLGKSDTPTTIRIAPADYQQKYDVKRWINW